jgi:hypothetical protein
MRGFLQRIRGVIGTGPRWAGCRALPGAPFVMGTLPDATLSMSSLATTALVELRRGRNGRA